MAERIVIHLDDLAKSIESESRREQSYDRWVGNCVVANGCFDIIHPGHLRVIQTLYVTAGYRIPVIAINSDSSVKRLKGSTRPFITESARAELLTSLKWPVNVVIFDEDTPQRLMDLLKPPIVVKGSQYSEESVVRWKDSRVVLCPMEDGWSTTKIIGK